MEGNVTIYPVRYDLKRIYLDNLEVILTPLTINGEKLIEYLEKKENFLDVRDELEWWEDDEEKQFEGFTSQKLMEEVVQKNNWMGKEYTKCSLMGKKRMLREDMVLLQIFSNKKEYLKRRKACLNIECIIKSDGAKWVDFTLQSRLMSKNVYSDLLKKKEVKDEA